MKEKLVKLKQFISNHKKVSIVFISIVLLIAFTTITMYSKTQYNNRKIKEFHTQYNEISSKIQTCTADYICNVLDVQDYFLENYGKKIYPSDKNFKKVISKSNDYYELIDQLQKIEVPKELDKDYKDLLNGYNDAKNNMDKINKNMIDKNTIVLDYDYTNTNERLSRLEDNLNTNMKNLIKEKGIK